MWAVLELLWPLPHQIPTNFSGIIITKSYTVTRTNAQYLTHIKNKFVSNNNKKLILLFGHV